MRVSRHVVANLTAYADGQLADHEAQAVEDHLAVCGRCRAAQADVVRAAQLLGRLAAVQPPSAVWASIDAAVPRPYGWRSWLRIPAVPAWTVPAVAALVLVAWLAPWPPGAVWEIERSGATATMAEGEWLDTGPASGARIIVGGIGTVDVSPDTRVRLGTARQDEYRLALARGTLSARIAAPPRVFFVETPASTVVDLGCAYTVTVDEDGTGLLRVTEGWAALEWEDREALVPAGARSRIRAGLGPGTPYFDDAPAPLVEALGAFDFASGGPAALASVLSRARVRDTLTLWHLLSRVGPGDRGDVYDRIVELAPPPADLSRDRVMALDPEALRYWREELAWKW